MENVTFGPGFGLLQGSSWVLTKPREPTASPCPFMCPVGQDRTYRLQRALLVEDGREDKGGQGARCHREVNVQHCPELGTVLRRGGRSKTGPEDPEVEGPCGEGGQEGFGTEAASSGRKMGPRSPFGSAGGSRWAGGKAFSPVPREVEAPYPRRFGDISLPRPPSTVPVPPVPSGWSSVPSTVKASGWRPVSCCSPPSSTRGWRRARETIRPK